MNASSLIIRNLKVARPSKMEALNCKSPCAQVANEEPETPAKSDQLVVVPGVES